MFLWLALRDNVVMYWVVAVGALKSERESTRRIFFFFFYLFFSPSKLQQLELDAFCEDRNVAVYLGAYLVGVDRGG